jgi:hypothetical protein
MDEDKYKEISYINNFEDYDLNINYDNEFDYDINIDEKIQDISYDYSLLVKKYIKDEDLYLFENFDYIDIMNFIEEIIYK